MNEILRIFPYKIISAGYNYLPALLVLSLGGDSVAVGLVSALYYMGLFFAPLVWSRFSKKANHKHMMTLGYLLMAVSLVLISYPKGIYAATLALAFFPAAIYFSVIAEIRKRKGSLGEKLGSLEQASGVAWGIGLIFSYISLQFMNLPQFALLLATLSALSFPIISLSFGDIGLFKNFRRGMKGLKEFQTWLFSKRATKFNFKKISHKELWLYSLMGVYSIASGIIIFQLPTVTSQVFGNGNLLYLCSFIGSISSVIFYKLAGRLRYASYPIGYAIKFVGLLILLASLYFVNLPLFFLFHIVNGIAWSFIILFFEYSCLKIGEETFGNAVSLRLLLIAIFSAISGYMIRNFGFIRTFALGVLINSLTILPYKKFKRSIPRGGQL